MASADYISREDVVNAINSTPFTMSMFLNKDQCVGARQARDSLALIVKKSIPAADVRPVVLCRDCKYSHPLMNSCKKCNYWSAHGLLVADHDFCSHGERSEESR